MCLKNCQDSSKRLLNAVSFLCRNTPSIDNLYT